jgi:acetyl esterase/lipase
MKKLIIGAFSFITSIFMQAQDIQGDWKGQLPSLQGELEIIFHIENLQGQWTTTLDVPAQGALGIPVERTQFQAPKLILHSEAMQIHFDAQCSGDAIVGQFDQNGHQVMLTLNRYIPELPGMPELASSDLELAQIAAQDQGNFAYNVADYFAKPNASAFQLSPDGRFLSYKEKDAQNKRHILIKEISSGKVIRAVEEKNELIKDYGWINNERIYFMMDNGGDENYHIYTSQWNGQGLKDLTPFEGITASIINLLKEQKDFMIISMNKNNPQIFEPYLLNVVTGELKLLFENKDVNNPIQDFIFDKNGELRGYSQMLNGIKTALYYKNLETGKFTLIQENDWDDTFSILSFNYASKNKNEAYVMTNLDSDKSRIILFDLAKREKIKEVYSHPTYDVSGLQLSRKRKYEVDFFHFDGERYEIIPVSSTYKAIHSKITQQFPNYTYYLTDFDDNESHFLFVVQSDKLYGQYYDYETSTGKITLLYDLMPQLKEKDMAEMRPIHFTSRDGMTLYGYITLPKEALNGKKVPMIVNPHGGPQGIRDSWGFNPEAQLFASRGYATLQVNFRISGGYGKQYLKSGFKQIGRKSMDDVEDGVQYVIKQGWVDSQRLAIYGASHGGYATLMGLVKTPDLYTCGVDYVGVSNIETFFASFPEYWKPYTDIMKEIWYDLDNPEEAAIAKEVSPVFQLEKIKKPLMVVQGANDPRVNINESDQMVMGLRARGVEVPYMIKYNEGHGFQREENSLELYKCMLGFFAMHLK